MLKRTRLCGLVNKFLYNPIWFDLYIKPGKSSSSWKILITTGIFRLKFLKNINYYYNAKQSKSLSSQQWIHGSWNRQASPFGPPRRVWWLAPSWIGRRLSWGSGRGKQHHGHIWQHHCMFQRRWRWVGKSFSKLKEKVSHSWVSDRWFSSVLKSFVWSL